MIVLKESAEKYKTVGSTISTTLIIAGIKPHFIGFAYLNIPRTGKHENRRKENIIPRQGKHQSTLGTQ